MKSLLVNLLSFLFMSTSVLSQSIDKEKLDAYFEVLDSANKFMGSVALSKNGKLIYQNQIGFADIESKKKPNSNTKYRIGSITKTFTTVLVLKAVEEKKIKLSQTIDSYFPEIKNANKTTILHLLNHRSGIASVTSREDYFNWNTTKQSRQELLKMIVEGGVTFEPDASMEYSNSNFILLTFILEDIYKKQYAKLLESKIIKPLGLKNTFYGGAISLSNNETFSYSFEGDWKKEVETDMSIPLGAGAIVSTPSDLTIFANALFSAKLVSKENLELMKTMKDGIGLGLFQIPFYENIMFGHNGGIDGFTSIFAYDIKNNIAFALVCNGTKYDNNLISITLLKAANGMDFEIPVFKNIVLTSEDLDKYVGVYTCEQISMSLTFTKNEGKLMAQATGQSAFALDVADENVFTYDPAGVVLEFNLSENTVVLKQGGGEYVFVKK